MSDEEVKKIEDRITKEIAKKLWNYDWDDDMFIDFQIDRFIEDKLEIDLKEFRGRQTVQY